MLRIILISAAAFTVPLPGPAHGAVLSGRVTINGTRPAPRALVRLSNMDSKYTSVTRTDVNGIYTLADAPDGAYLLEVEVDGQLAFRESTTLSGPATKDIDLITTDRVASVQIQITEADDDALVLINGAVVAAWRRDGPHPTRVALTSGSNRLEVRVYNQRSFTGGVRLFGGRKPEGWHYCIRISATNNPQLLSVCDGESEPAEHGPRFDKIFTVLTGDLLADPRSNDVVIQNLNPKAWVTR